MRGTAALVLARNVYCLAAVVVLASSLVGSASGSCLSYGHSCWGAHGKRSGSGNIVNGLQQRPIESNVGAQGRRMPPLDERWLLSRLVNRQLTQVPLAARLRAARILEEDSPIMDKFDKNVELKDLAKSDQKLINDELNNLLMPEERDMSDSENDQTLYKSLHSGLYKILRNID